MKWPGYNKAHWDTGYRKQAVWPLEACKGLSFEERFDYSNILPWTEIGLMKKNYNRLLLATPSVNLDNLNSIETL